MWLRILRSGARSRRRSRAVWSRRWARVCSRPRVRLRPKASSSSSCAPEPPRSWRCAASRSSATSACTCPRRRRCHAAWASSPRHARSSALAASRVRLEPTRTRSAIISARRARATQCTGRCCTRRRARPRCSSARATRSWTVLPRSRLILWNSTRPSTAGRSWWSTRSPRASRSTASQASSCPRVESPRLPTTAPSSPRTSRAALTPRGMRIQTSRPSLRRRCAASRTCARTTS
mmetsp:Transcript_29050/g.68899  ORF Transcript_29050/g.68899 Transcript_29050/m.68899 type:complete len:235 (-) Transcript_29050:437-1141(-)